MTNQYNELSTIPCRVVSISPDRSDVIFTLPSGYIQSFTLMFQSMASLFSALSWQTKIDSSAINRRIELKKESIKKLNDEYERCCLETYLKYIEKGNTPRESLSLTVSSVYKNFAFSSYDNVKKVLQENKLLKKTGFYKKILPVKTAI